MSPLTVGSLIAGPAADAVLGLGRKVVDTLDFANLLGDDAPAGAQESGVDPATELLAAEQSRQAAQDRTELRDAIEELLAAIRAHGGTTEGQISVEPSGHGAFHVRGQADQRATLEAGLESDPAWSDAWNQALESVRRLLAGGTDPGTIPHLTLDGGAVDDPVRAAQDLQPHDVRLDVSGGTATLVVREIAGSCQADAAVPVRDGRIPRPACRVWPIDPGAARAASCGSCGRPAAIDADRPNR